MSNSDCCHILVVDDEPHLEDLMRQRMRREVRRGIYSLDFASNGREALEILENKPEIEIVLSDINMPVMDGLAMIEKIDGTYDRVKTVMVSAYGDMKNIRGAMNRGAFDFVTKPVDFEDLKITITRTAEAVRLERQNEENKKQLLSIETELETASRMQQNILPTRFPELDSCNIHANMEPARAVGGDFYDVKTIEDEHKIGICIADVSGKGVPAALFMMSSWTLLRGSSIVHTEDPALVVKDINNGLSENNDSMMFVTLFYAIYKARSRTLKYVNCGHNFPVLFRQDGTVEELESTNGVALGIMGGIEFEQKEITLDPGDVLVMYTDGVNEAERSDEELFGMDRFKNIFEGNPPPTDAKAVTDVTFKKVREFVGDFPQSDDITCLTLCVKS